MQPLIVANWKMGGSQSLAERWVKQVSAFAAQKKAVVVLCPPAVYLSEINRQPHAPLALGGQDCHQAKEGAFTGDISAGMLKEMGCAYVIVGHSERRSAYRETDTQVQAKAAAAMAAGLIPIICVGETLVQRESGQAESVVSTQLKGSVPEGAAGTYIIAYEPVWAIGTGQTPTAQDIATMHKHIIPMLGQGARVLYGGSVKATNAAEILAVSGVAGVLVGSGSLSIEEFCAILDCAAAG